MTVAALLPQQWEFKIIDANVEPLLNEHFEWADIVCTGGMLSQQKSMISVIDKAHQHDCLVVVGGSDVTAQPDKYTSADFIVQGEGEITIPMFIQDLAKGSNRGVYNSTEKADMTKSVIPRFDLIRFKDYIHVGIQYSRGCPFSCEFCDIIELYGRIPRVKTPEQIIKELQTLYDLSYRGHVDFVDDNFIGNKKNVKKVLPVIKEWSEANKFPFYFSTESTINMADDENLLQMMKDVDFRFVFLGIESPECEILESVNKKINLDKSITVAVKKIHSYGIIVNGGFIIGFDNERDRTAENMIRCIQDSGICMAMLGLLYALPQTQLTRRLKVENRLFEIGSTVTDNTKIDQTTSGLNFVTARPRLDVLKDFAKVIKYIYEPKRYYERVLKTGLDLDLANKHKPGFVGVFKYAKAFLKLCRRIGFNRTTGWLYWKLIFTMLIKNPKAVEAAVNLSAMFMHFHKHSKYIMEIMNKEIEIIESFGEDEYNKSMVFAPVRNSSLSVQAD
jgi:radical SAM superfamily enzyme YgiQ (UPF0313 family)